MRLLHTSTGELKEFRDEDIPRYAILSHVWEEKELSFEDLRALYALQAASHTSDILSMTPFKIRECCRIAREYGYSWVWVDTCCIDKSSSAELSEAINCMFAWYKRADVCLAFLFDVNSDDIDPDSECGGATFRRSKWWTRGWTLQELLAPDTVSFFSSNWGHIGTKAELSQTVFNITGIEIAILKGSRSIQSASVAQRMSWAAKRVTTRLEDRAYSLFGIFDVHMSTIYGEGSHAFIRLQEEILLRTDDLTIFCWGDFLHSHSSSTRSSGAIPIFRRTLMFQPQWPKMQASFPLRDLTITPLSGHTESTPLFAGSPDDFADSAQFETLPHHRLASILGRKSLPSEYRRIGTMMRIEAPIIAYTERINKERKGFEGMVLPCQAANRKLVILFFTRRTTPPYHYDLGIQIESSEHKLARKVRGLLIPVDNIRTLLDRFDIRPIILPTTTPSGESFIHSKLLSSRKLAKELRSAKYLMTSIVISGSSLARLYRTHGLCPRDSESDRERGPGSLLVTLPPIELIAYEQYETISTCIVDASGKEAFTLTIGIGCPCRAKQKSSWFHGDNGLDLLWISAKAPLPVASTSTPHVRPWPCAGGWHLRHIPRGQDPLLLDFSCAVGGPVYGTMWSVKLILSHFRIPTLKASKDEVTDALCENRKWLMEIVVTQ